MTTVPTLVHVIAAYSAWEHPWEFHDYVANFKGLSVPDKDLFEAAWREAINFKYWQSTDLAQSASVAAKAVLARFPNLDNAVAEAIVNAAAYEWR